MSLAQTTPSMMMGLQSKVDPEMAGPHPSLELESYVEEAVHSVGIVVLRVLREAVGTVVTRAVVVGAVLLVTTGLQVSVVGDVLHREVDAQALAVLEADVLTD